MPSKESLQIARLHLLARQELFDRWKPEDNPEDRRHCPVTRKGLIVENEILQTIPFNGHEHDPMGSVDRGENPLLTGFQVQCACRADPDADPAPQATVQVRFGHFPRMW